MTDKCLLSRACSRDQSLTLRCSVLSQRDGESRTALHYAVAYKHKDIFYELLASGADLTATVRPVSSCFLTLTERHVEVSKLLGALQASDFFMHASISDITRLARWKMQLCEDTPGALCMIDFESAWIGVIKLL